MGTIQSTVGLITGFPIQDTIDKLVALQSAPRDNLTTANNKLNSKQIGIASLEALLLSLQINSSKLAGNLLYSERTAVSSSPSLLGVTTSGTIGAGNFQFTPIRQVQSNQFTSSRIASSTAALGASNFAVRFGGFINNGTSLDLVNSGQGFDRGKIRIVDRSGATADVDLGTARTIDDVISAINGTAGIRVTASAAGNHLRLTDNTGQTSANLQVLEVNGGTTAESLGLAGISVAGTQANGADILRAFDELSLSKLDDGNGVRCDNALADLKVNFRDGTDATLDLHRLNVTGTRALGTTQGTLDPNARLTFIASQAGSTYAGVQVVFQNDNNVVAGSNETAAYDATNKILTFKIRAGQTKADDVIAALKRNPTVSQQFTASRGGNANGTGLVSVTDTTTTAGPKSSAITPGTTSPEARIVFTATHGGSSGDGVSIKFVANANIQAGQETVAYDDSDPQNKQLVFQVAAGQTSADQVIAALNNDPTASQLFTAARASGSTGQGIINVADSAVTTGGALIEPQAGTNESSLGDVLKALNNLAPGKLKAEIASDGNRLVLTDLTTDTGGTFSISDLNGSHAAEDLGLVGTANGDTITGERLLAGLNSSLLSSLNGGKGIANLGILQITDRSGASASVDLSQAETLQDVIDTINLSAAQANLGVVAAVNQARDGIQLTDSTGSTNSNLIVANGNDATTTADRLGLAINAASTSVTSGNLKLQVVGENTTLASLNGGKGVSAGSFSITDTRGVTATVNITASQTIGDVLTSLNSLGLAIDARINDAGDGIALVDTNHGTGTLTVTEGNSKTAANLHLLSPAKSVDINSQSTQVIDGSTTLTLDLSATDSLQSLVDKINNAGVGVSASILNDGSSVKPFRLIITSQIAGTAGQLRIDASQLPFSLAETAQAQDALLQVNTPGNSNGLLVSSSTNTFKDVLPGATLQVNGTSSDPVTISVTGSDTTLSSTLSSMVNTYNQIRSKLRDLTAFDPSSGTSGVLAGDAAALRVDSDLARFFTGRFFGVGSIQSLNELGIQANTDGTLTFNQDDFSAKFAADPDAVQKFFTTTQIGFGDRIKNLTDQLAGGDNSLLESRNNAISATIDANTNRIAALTAHLDAIRQRLSTQFYNAELAVSKIRNNLNALSSITAFSYATPLNSTSSSSSSSSS